MQSNSNEGKRYLALQHIVPHTRDVAAARWNPEYKSFKGFSGFPVYQFFVYLTDQCKLFQPGVNIASTFLCI